MFQMHSLRPYWPDLHSFQVLGDPFAWGIYLMHSLSPHWPDLHSLQVLGVFKLPGRTLKPLASSTPSPPTLISDDGLDSSSQDKYTRPSLFYSDRLRQGFMYLLEVICFLLLTTFPIFLSYHTGCRSSTRSIYHV